MTTPRSEQIDLDATQYYHCMNRCVRGSYLCGENADGTIDYNHRKSWIVTQIKYLSKIFAIKICAYGVMSNHYHLVLYVDRKQALTWTDEEVHLQWGNLFPQDAKQYAEKSRARSQKIKLWRERLYSISWYMRCLNQLIARLSNKEDACKGHFWEGRFKSQALLDEGAILSAMAYVDLNPIRAGLASTPESSDFTSIQERLRYLTKVLKPKEKYNRASINMKIDKSRQCEELLSFSVQIPDCKPSIDFKLSDYIELVEETGRIIREDKIGAIPDNISPILERLGLFPIGWMAMVKKLAEQIFICSGSSATDVQIYQ